MLQNNPKGNNMYYLRIVKKITGGPFRTNDGRFKLHVIVEHRGQQTPLILFFKKLRDTYKVRLNYEV